CAAPWTRAGHAGSGAGRSDRVGGLEASTIRSDFVRWHSGLGRVGSAALYHAADREGADLGVDFGAHCLGILDSVLGSFTRAAAARHRLRVHGAQKDHLELEV